MRLRPEVRVGVIVFVAFVALIAVYMFLGGLGLRAQTYELSAVFTNVQTVQKGTDVRMAGVKIGVVSDVVLTPQNRAKVVMLIYDGYKIPRGSVARVSSAGVIGDYFMEIVPSERQAYVKPGTMLKSQEIATINDLLGQASGLMTGLKGLTTDLKISTEGLNKILGDEQLAKSIKNTIENMELASLSGLAIARNLNESIAGATPQVQQALNRVTTASERLVDISNDFATISRNVKSNLIENGGITRMQAILQNAQTASANLASASAGLASLAGDKQLISDIKETVEQSKIAATQAAELSESLNARFGKRKKAPETAPKKETYVPFKGLTGDMYVISKDNPFRFDVNYVYNRPGEDEFYRFGLFDVGESTKLNLQAGKALDKNSSVRYGLYASRIGIGYDRGVADKLSVHADLYRPNDLTLELKGLYKVDPNWGFWLGTDNLFDDPNLLVGVQYRK